MDSLLAKPIGFIEIKQVMDEYVEKWPPRPRQTLI
jgi:hypothetical protein